MGAEFISGPGKEFEEIVQDAAEDEMDVEVMEQEDGMQRDGPQEEQEGQEQMIQGKEHEEKEEDDESLEVNIAFLTAAFKGQLDEVKGLVSGKRVKRTEEGDGSAAPETSSSSSSSANTTMDSGVVDSSSTSPSSSCKKQKVSEKSGRGAIKADIFFSDNYGRTGLHLAAEEGHLAVVEYLLQRGCPWHSLDCERRTAAEYAKEAGHEEIYKCIKEHGIRAELILGMVGRRTKLTELCGNGSKQKEKSEEGKEEEAEAVDVSKPTNDEYLKMPLKYEENTLLDFENNGVMMGWEDPLMEKHARVICGESVEDDAGKENGKNQQNETTSSSKGCGHILNIGFGLGLIDTYIQSHGPVRHTIVEAHPDVYAHMKKTGWLEKPGVTVLFGRWQDVEFETYDGIFFDTFGEEYEDLREFHELVPNILNPGGIYSFFNGLAGTNYFFHDVYCEIAAMELRDMGLETEYVPVDIDTFEDEKVWVGVKGKYWTLPRYNLPICKFLEY